MPKEKKKMERIVPVSKNSKVVLRGWRDISNNWRSKWLRYGTGTSLTHCTLTIGQLTLHVDYRGSNWYPSPRLFHTYEGHFEKAKEIYLGSVKRPVYIKPDAGSTWSVIKWKYFLGSRPKCCSTGCIDALRQNGFDSPELIPPHKLIEHYDYLRNER